MHPWGGAPLGPQKRTRTNDSELLRMPCHYPLRLWHRHVLSKHPARGNVDLRTPPRGLGSQQQKCVPQPQATGDALRNRVAQRILCATCRAARLKMGRPEESVPHQDLPHEAQAALRLRTLKPATCSRQPPLGQDQAPQGRITQELISEDLLERIFAGFCIGK